MTTSTGSPPDGEPPVVTTIIEVLRAASVISAALTPVVRRFGLSLPAFNVLHTLAHADGALSPKEISGRQVIRPQTLSDILGTLEDEGLVDRIRDRRDRRMLLVTLSATGRARYERCCDPLLAVESQLLTGLGDVDLTTLRTLLGQITDDARLPVTRPSQAGRPRLAGIDALTSALVAPIYHSALIDRHSRTCQASTTPVGQRVRLSRWKGVRVVPASRDDDACRTDSVAAG